MGRNPGSEATGIIPLQNGNGSSLTTFRVDINRQTVEVAKLFLLF